jgi:hypothetical protein
MTTGSYSHFVMNVLKAGSAAGVTKQEELNKMASLLWEIYGPYLIGFQIVSDQIDDVLKQEINAANEP